MTLTSLMAPLTPLTSEHMYLNLRRLLPPDQRRPSIHLMPFPASNQTDGSGRREEVLERMRIMQRVLVAARAARDRRGIPVKVPLKSACVLVNTQSHVDALAPLHHYITAELNLRHLVRLPLLPSRLPALPGWSGLARVSPGTYAYVYLVA
jgi:isoleucyl-tRNA synthetase